MKLRKIASHLVAFAAALTLAGCAVEEEADESAQDPDTFGVRMVGIGADGEELPSGADAVGRPVHKEQARAATPGEGRPEHPWQSVLGPVPDPWADQPPPAQPCAGGQSRP
jgi:hypothetical protein